MSTARVIFTAKTSLDVFSLSHNKFRLFQVLGDPRIDSLNDYLQGLQTETVSFTDHNPSFVKLPNILNNGGLHMRNAGTRQVAVNTTVSLTGQQPTPVAGQQPATTTKTTAITTTRKQTRQSGTDSEWQLPKQNKRPATNTQQKNQEWSLQTENRFTPLEGNHPTEEHNPVNHVNRNAATLSTDLTKQQDPTEQKKVSVGTTKTNRKVSE